MKRLPAIIMIFAWCPAYAASDNPLRPGIVQGQVNSDQGTPLAGARIQVSYNLDFSNTLLAATTNKNGQFSLDAVLPGQYFLRVAQQGYQPTIKAPVSVQAGKTTYLNLILQSLVHLGNPDDPANWDFKTVLRSAQGRRMIFREKETVLPTEALKLPPVNATGLFGQADRSAQPFQRAASVELSSSDPSAGGDNYTFPSPALSGIKSNFGFSEPMGTDSRYVFAGQINSGYDSLWKVKNQVDFKLSESQVLTLAVDYSRLGFTAPRISTLLDPKQTLTRDTEFVNNQATFQSLTLGVGNYWRFWDPVTLFYGVDMALLKGQTTRAFVIPNLEIIIQPTEKTAVRAVMSGKRLTENESIRLSGNESISLAQPFQLARINDTVSVGKSLHYDVSLARKLPLQTTLELGAFKDRFSGDPLPLMASWKEVVGKSNPFPFYMARENGNSEGMRVVVNRQFLEFLRSSIAYVYGTSPTLQGFDVLITGEAFPEPRTAKTLFHTVTTRLDADLPQTNTRISTSFRWVFGTPLGPLDPFSDYDNLGSGNSHFSIRQVVPVPNLWGVSGKWEVLVDMRNFLKSDDPRLQLPQGKLFILRQPRTIRFGISFRM